MDDADGRIWIVQCLCPSRHAIMALAFDPREMGPEAAIERLRGDVAGLIAGGILDAWCALCLSREFHYEAGRTRFRTMEEAKPALMACQRDQLATRARILSLRRTDA